jgi:hypothetical protein
MRQNLFFSFRKTTVCFFMLGTFCDLSTQFASPARDRKNFLLRPEVYVIKPTHKKKGANNRALFSHV